MGEMGEMDWGRAEGMRFDEFVRRIVFTVGDCPRDAMTGGVDSLFRIRGGLRGAAGVVSIMVPPRPFAWK